MFFFPAAATKRLRLQSFQNKTRKLVKIFNAGTDFNTLSKSVRKFLFILQTHRRAQKNFIRKFGFRTLFSFRGLGAHGIFSQVRFRTGQLFRQGFPRLYNANAAKNARKKFSKTGFYTVFLISPPNLKVPSA